MLARTIRSSPDARPWARLRLELPLEQVERALGAIDEDQASRPDGEHLARQLRPDRARAARDQHRAVADDRVHVDRMLRDGRPPQQILDTDPPDAVGVHAAVDEVRDRGDGPDLEMQRHRGLDHAPHGVARGARHRDQQAGGTGGSHGPLHRIDAAEDAQPCDDPVGEPAIVVEEAHRPDTRGPVTRRRPGDQDPGLAGAIEQGRLAVALTRVRRRHGVAGGPDAEPDATEDGDAQEQLDGPEGAREPMRPGVTTDHGGPVEGGDGDDASRAWRPRRSGPAPGRSRSASAGCTGRAGC